MAVMSFAQMPILAWWPAIACYQHLGYTPLGGVKD